MPGPARSCAEDANLDAIGWYCFNSGNTTHPVMQKMPNGWGLYDVAGNATEWVNDGYDPFGYGEVPITDPLPTFPLRPGTYERVVRGGKANRWSGLCRSAKRFAFPYYARTWAIGFRLARTE